MDCNPSGFSVPGTSQARILEWVAISFSRVSSQPRSQTHVSCIVGRFFTTKPPGSHTGPSPKGPHEGRRDSRRQESPWSKPLKNQRENWSSCRKHLSHTTGNAVQSSQGLPPRNPRKVPREKMSARDICQAHGCKVTFQVYHSDENFPAVLCQSTPLCRLIK